MTRVARDHFVPKAYLRGFTPEYLRGDKGGKLVQYSAGLGWAKTLSINDYIACEPEFYAHHPLDKEWSQTIERRWPSVRDGLKQRQLESELFSELLWFVAAQFIRTHRFMNHVARLVQMRQAKPRRVFFEGREVNGLFMDMADTGEVMDQMGDIWKHTRKLLEEDYTWTVYHNSCPRLFLTSDDPCQWDPSTGGVTMPVSLNIALVGKMTSHGDSGHFRHTNVSVDIVGKINRETVACCRSWVYAHEDTPGLRKFVNKNYRPRDIALMGRSFANGGTFMDDAEMQGLVQTVERFRARH